GRGPGIVRGSRRRFGSGSAEPTTDGSAMDRLEIETVRRAAEEARERGLDRDVGDLLEWAWETLGERLMMSTAFGKSGMVILHVLKDRAPKIPVYFLDTGFHFRETLEYLA